MAEEAPFGVLAPPDGETQSRLSSPLSSAVEAGQMLVVVRRMEDTVEKGLATMQNQLECSLRLQEELKQKVDTLSVSMRKDIDDLRTATQDILPRLEAGRPRLSQKLHNTPLEHLVYAVGPDRAKDIFLGLCCQVTVASFLHSVPDLRRWMSDRVWNGLQGHTQIIKPVSGLSVIMFAAENNEKARYATPPGLLWSYIIRRTMVYILGQARTELFQEASFAVGGVAGSSAISIPGSGAARVGTSASSPVRRMPKWLAAFKDKEDIREVVNAVSREMETKAGEVSAPSLTSSAGSWSSSPRGGRQGAPPAGRNRRGGTPPTGGATSTARRNRGVKRKRPPPERDQLRRQAVEDCRYGITKHLNTGRVSCRVSLNSALFFLVDKATRYFHNTAEARVNGYYITFPHSSSEQLTPPADGALHGSIWDIPTAVVGNDSASVGENSNRLAEMKSAFPCMALEITYKKRVVKDRSGRSSEVATTGGDRVVAGDAGGTLAVEGAIPEESILVQEPQNEEVIYVPIVEKCNLHEVALDILMEIFQTKSKGAVLGSSELMLRTIHIVALGLRGVLRQSMNEAISNTEKVAKGLHVGLQATDVVNLMLTRTWKGSETKQFREKYAAKFYMSWEEYISRQNAPDPAAVSPDEVLANIAVREADEDNLFFCG